LYQLNGNKLLIRQLLKLTGFNLFMVMIALPFLVELQ